MSLLAALLLLVSASDSFDSIDPQWTAGTRGLPQLALEEREGDSCLILRATNTEPTPGIDDLVRSFPRPVLRAEKPFAVAHVWLPPFNEWPTENKNYAGFRLTISDQYPRFVWPGIFISRVSGVPCFTARVLIDSAYKIIPSSGWWTLGIRSETYGSLAFYAVGDRNATLTEADRFYTDQSGYTFVSSFDGWFLQVATPEPWYFADVKLYADIKPKVTLSIDSGYPNQPWAVQRSLGLSSWNTFTTIQGDSEVTTDTESLSEFFRLIELPEQ